ncbi:MAG TPA: BamA/TamA family outer membrane protein [Halalkalibaculum sp.]|nr:BamA/TamA family outer membrane protein [Halalkalibaculum sp.]
MNICQLFKATRNIFFAFILAFVAFCQVEARDLYIANADTTGSENTKPHPNAVAYSSGKSFFGHVLATPSYLFHWATRPLGWGIKFSERKLPQLLQGERGPYGVYPLFELGGDALGAYGLLLYHNKLTRYNHKARIEALFGSENYNDFDFEYTIPKAGSDRSRVELDASYSNDPIKSFYGDNDSRLSAENIYATENLEIDAVYSILLSEKIDLSLLTGYQKMDIKESESDDADELPSIPGERRGTSTLYSLGSSVRFDFAQGTPRIFSGSRYLAALQWYHSLTDGEFHYLQYSFEWQQFIPLKFLTNERRFAFKGSLKKTAPLAGKSIPFFKKPGLGSSYDLRGFQSDRFQDDGSLLLTLEYRYPLWNFADITLFVDEGQVFSRYSEISIPDFHTSYGFGFHLISSKGFAFRSEFAFSKESSRVILSINPNF